MDEKNSQAARLLSEPVHFPCGKVAKNRMTKAPMEELLAKGGGSSPTKPLLNLYKHWALGGWGMLITGEIIIVCLSSIAFY